MVALGGEGGDGERCWSAMAPNGGRAGWALICRVRPASSLACGGGHRPARFRWLWQAAVMASAAEAVAVALWSGGDGHGGVGAARSGPFGPRFGPTSVQVTLPRRFPSAARRTRRRGVVPQLVVAVGSPSCRVVVDLCNSLSAKIAPLCSCVAERCSSTKRCRSPPHRSCKLSEAFLYA